MKKKVILLVVCLLAILFITVGKYNKFDKNRSADYITCHSLSKSHNCCAWYVMKALWVGGKPCFILPAFGYSYYLPIIGFNEVNKDGYDPQKGDIVVFPHVNGHIYGHIAMWNGEQWVSDFKQRGIIVNKAYTNSNYKIFRYN